MAISVSQYYLQCLPTAIRMLALVFPRAIEATDLRLTKSSTDTSGADDKGHGIQLNRDIYGCQL